MTQKEISKDFLNLCAFGNSKKAFELYVDKNFKHHNAYFKGDADSLMIAMEESHKNSPNKIFEIRQIFHEGDSVALHSYIQTESNLEIAVVHILKFENEKIIELWDIIQQFPENIINENGMF
ncbi:MAG: nuclear transport factor 2 family protein [Ignavibacteriales bacterium]|nr:nuclear transport factor 2 family protein [Ignavibacteriota bacterium]MCB9248655.1 nuclear transport factor 2 family protein [Ignavibacteriales bacterium]